MVTSLKSGKQKTTGKRKAPLAGTRPHLEQVPRRKRLKVADQHNDSQSRLSIAESGCSAWDREERESLSSDARSDSNYSRNGENLQQKTGSSASDDEPHSPNVFMPQDRIGLSRKKLTDITIATPKMDSFSSLGISSTLQSALTSMSIKVPTEVQKACIPPLLQGRDCIGNAKTGSGKTITFALPILQKLSADPYGIFALVLTPTRELAFQISEQFAVLGVSLNIRTAVVVGGMDMITQAIELGNRPHIVIATPGRLVDYLRSNSGEWDLSRIKFLVLDEADRLLTPTFSPELNYLFDILPKERQTCLFTATMTPQIDSLAEASPKPGKQKPFVHRVTESTETVSTLKQSYVLVPSHVREAYLYDLLRNPPESTLGLRRAPPEPAQNSRKSKSKSKNKNATPSEEVIQPPPTIIFCARARTAAYLTALLKTLSIRSTALHSRLTQRERLSSLSLFRASVVPVLVSTDVGARGLDIEDVAMIINWDLPQEPEEYTHRVGRTARAGKGGVAISFVTERDEEKILKIEERIRTRLEELTLKEERVLEQLNVVSTGKRLANMELHDSKFGKREEVRRVKNGKV